MVNDIVVNDKLQQFVIVVNDKLQQFVIVVNDKLQQFVIYHNATPSGTSPGLLVRPVVRLLM